MKFQEFKEILILDPFKLYLQFVVEMSREEARLWKANIPESASTEFDINYSLCCLHCYGQVRNYHYLGSLRIHVCNLSPVVNEQNMQLIY